MKCAESFGLCYFATRDDDDDDDEVGWGRARPNRKEKLVEKEWNFVKQLTIMLYLIIIYFQKEGMWSR